jgi:very-short-patch-repair endonuclease
LRWHYRSRDERLIAFSNHYFYEGRLNTFPSAATSTEGRGVECAYVLDGVYGRGKDRKNPREARRVAELIIDQLKRYPERSIGTVAMSSSQKESIEDALDEEFAEAADLRAVWQRDGEEPNFIKALENVQGDERDTMIISVGYGRDIDGALSYTFGPLNAPGGEKRLNVLVTRAKWHTILVTSLRSSELSGVNPNNKGATALRNFIAYAESGGVLPRPPAISTDAETNEFEDAVREALISRGLQVDAQVGASRYRIDLAIRDRRDPTRYIIGVECDGATYHSSRSARDRDLLRHEVLRLMGWRIHRLWSTEWFRDPDGSIEQVLRSVQRAEQEPPERSIETQRKRFVELVAPPTGSRRPATPATESKTRPAGEQYRRYNGSVRPRAQLMDVRHTAELAGTIVEVVTTEAPIMEELLLERLREVHEVGRAGNNIRINVGAAIRYAAYQGQIETTPERSGLVLTVPRRTLATFRTPGEGVHRGIELIPEEEIALAVLFLVQDQFGMQRDSVPGKVVNLFGFDRARAPSADRIREVVDDLIEAGRLRTQGPNVTVT